MLAGSARDSYVPGSVGENKRILLLLLMMDGCGRKEVGRESSLDVRRQTSVGLGLQGWGSGGWVHGPPGHREQLPAARSTCDCPQAGPACKGDCVQKYLAGD